MKVQLMAVLMIAAVTVNAIPNPNLYYSGFPPAETTQVKRSGPIDPEWNQLGWAWGKRSVGMNEVPRRLVRAMMHPVKKNPDWQDLGFAWGRK